MLLLAYCNSEMDDRCILEVKGLRVPDEGRMGPIFLVCLLINRPLSLWERL